MTILQNSYFNIHYSLSDLLNIIYQYNLNGSSYQIAQGIMTIIETGIYT